MNGPHATSTRLTDSSTSWLRAGAISGFAFTVFLALAWFLNGAETPHYLAPNHDWTTWANNTEMKGRFAAFFALLAGLTFLPFAATVRAVLGSGEVDDKGSARLAQIAYAGGLIGMPASRSPLSRSLVRVPRVPKRIPSSAERSPRARSGRSSSRRWALPRSSELADW